MKKTILLTQVMTLLKSIMTLLFNIYIVIRFAVKILVMLMLLRVIWDIGVVVYMPDQRITFTPTMLLGMNDLLVTLGAFLALLIAIEVFMNISIFLEIGRNPGQISSRYCINDYRA